MRAIACLLSLTIPLLTGCTTWPLRANEKHASAAWIAPTASGGASTTSAPVSGPCPMLRAGFNRGHVGQGDMQERLDNLARRTVNGRVGQPSEIAQAIFFLADSGRSSFMTGQAMVVDGGATARLSTE